MGVVQAPQGQKCDCRRDIAFPAQEQWGARPQFAAIASESRVGNPPRRDASPQGVAPEVVREGVVEEVFSFPVAAEEELEIRWRCRRESAERQRFAAPWGSVVLSMWPLALGVTPRGSDAPGGTGWPHRVIAFPVVRFAPLPPRSWFGAELREVFPQLSGRFVFVPGESFPWAPLNKACQGHIRGLPVARV